MSHCGVATGLNGSLVDAFGLENVVVFDLESLDKADVAAEAKAAGLDAGDFDRWVDVAGASSLSERPITLRFLIDEYRGGTPGLDLCVTPGFLAATKVVWLRESTLFLSGEKRADVARSLLTAWAAGREREAAEKLVTLAALAGWSQAQFAETRWTTVPKTRVREIFGEEL